MTPARNSLNSYRIGGASREVSIMAENPYFSVVIPTYNRSELVVHAVESVLRQEEGDLEVVVSDNLSTDNTGDAVRAIRDPRVRYVRTDRHMVIADSWEFARTHARGRFVMMLSDDDAMLKFALTRFRKDLERFGADFAFCRVAEYRDAGFPGNERNRVDCPSFTGKTRRVDRDEFIAPLFAFRHFFTMHPSAFFFERRLAEEIAQRTGRFFRTNGVEYYAWPLSAALARNIVFIDVPLIVLGRTNKSWGSTLELGNPGKKQIEAMIADVEQVRTFVPLKNFCITNLVAEGILTAQSVLPELLDKYPFDEKEYLRSTAKVLARRIGMGVDVSAEVSELLAYAERYPELPEQLREKLRHRSSQDGSLRDLVRKMPLYGVARWLRARRRERQLAARIERGEIDSGFSVSGASFDFRDALGCSEFLTRALSSRQ